MIEKEQIIEREKEKGMKVKDKWESRHKITRCR